MHTGCTRENMTEIVIDMEEIDEKEEIRQKFMGAPAADPGGR